MVTVGRYSIRMENGYKRFCGKSNAKGQQKSYFWPIAMLKWPFLTIKYGHGTTNRSMVNCPNDTIMDINSVKIPQASGICI